jgi:hypothetical protein
MVVRPSTATPETLVIPDTGEIVSDAVFLQKLGGEGGEAMVSLLIVLQL